MYIPCYILWSPALHVDSLPSEPPEKPYIDNNNKKANQCC